MDGVRRKSGQSLSTGHNLPPNGRSGKQGDCNVCTKLQWLLGGREFRAGCSGVRGMQWISYFDTTLLVAGYWFVKPNKIIALAEIHRCGFRAVLFREPMLLLGHTTGVPKKYVSKPCTLVMRRLALCSIESICPKNSYHLHGIASGVNFRQLETPPRSSPGVFSPPTGVVYPVRLCAKLQADPVNGTQRAKL